ncbi:hypothetical protein [Novipirellula maiorica]|uniref:hypothetical protein n=1 Tax=Novipirellula maiorica TaxID=1265734 RepID=UPI001181B77F|nr:hypothetical protein [Rhodopirellula maiorica]
MKYLIKFFEFDGNFLSGLQLISKPQLKFFRWSLLICTERSKGGVKKLGEVFWRASPDLLDHRIQIVNQFGFFKDAAENRVVAIVLAF